jgi:UrcA family protein
MDARTMASIAAASVVGSLLLIATTSGAQHQRAVVVEKRITPMALHVSLADLSLARKKDQKILYHRVGEAVQQVCPQVDGDGYGYDVQGCDEFAWAGARPQMMRAINAAKAGFPLAMTVAVSAAAQ